jgi:oligopeptide transport system substrate-binding protein
MFIIHLIFLMMAALLTTHCQPSGTSQSSLRLNFTEGDLPSLTPSGLQGHIRGRTLGKLLYEGLVTKVPGGKIELAGAEKVDISSDGREYLFTLRKHFWSDGTAVTAYDYLTAWNSFLEPSSDAAHLLYIIKNARLVKEGKVSFDALGMRALDEKKLLITLEYPSPYFLEILSHPLFSPVKKSSNGSLCFNGPFKVKEWRKGSLLRLESNPRFWNAKEIHLKSIEISYVHDFATAFSMYEKNEIDWIGNPFCRLTLEDMEFLKQKGKLIQETTNRPLWVYFNTEKTPFTSHYIRQAFSQAIDREFLTKHVLLEDNPLLTPLPIRLTLSLASLVCDLDEAKKNFDKGLQELGIAKENFPALELSYQDSHKNLCVMLKEIWEKVFGITVTLKITEWNVLKNNLEKGNFSIASCTESSLFPDPIELLERFEFLNRNNFCRWVNSGYQENIRLARQSVDPEIRKDFLRNAEEILICEMPFIPISNRNHAFSYPKNLKSVLVDSSGYVDFRFAYWR